VATIKHADRSAEGSGCSVVPRTQGF